MGLGTDPTADHLAQSLGELVSGTTRTIAVAESLTGGSLSAHLAAASGSGDWFRGGLVAYSRQVKHRVLDVPEGPVVSARAAAAMAAGVARLLHADVGLAVTGVGGPDRQDDEPPGTVYIGLHRNGTTATQWHWFPGDPDDVVRATCRTALDWLVTSWSTPPR